MTVAVDVSSVDPVTGGPMKDKQDPFENMSAEEIETEAEKLGVLIDKLNKLEINMDGSHGNYEGRKVL